jgi:predicted deacylase
LIIVGNVACSPGEKKFGELYLTEDSFSDVKIPAGVILGNVPGPTVCIVAGTHGCEYVGIDTAIRVFHDYSPNEIRGALIVLPVINPAAFRTVTPYVNPMDEVDMGFVFTGSKNGTTTEKMCTEILEQAVFKSNYVLDLHGGDINEIMLTSVIAGVTGDEKLDSETLKLARAFGTEFIILHRYTKSPASVSAYSHATSLEAKAAQSGVRYTTTLESAAATRGIPGIVGEIGTNGISTPSDVAYYFKRVHNVLVYLKMIDGVVEVPRNQKLISNSTKIRTTRGGIFSPALTVGQFVERGSLIGKVIDLKGDQKESIVAPSQGVISFLFTKHVVDAGHMVASLSTKVEELPPVDFK